MPEAEYSVAAMAKYHEVLASAVDEKPMQQFFEEHPPLLPFAFPDYTGHGAYLQALVSQPELAGLGIRQPDFLWLSRNSGEIRPVLIEIEKPTKKWATTGKNPQPTADLTQALNQLRQWREWMDSPQNQMIFLERYGVPLNWRRRQFRPLYVLVYGRKDENPEEIAKLRTEHERPNQRLITYDHIHPEPPQTNYISVKNDGIGAFCALHMPAAAKLTPSEPEPWLKISGRVEMVERNTWISEERKRYLIEDRIPSWDDWAKNYWVRQDGIRKAWREAKRPA